MSRHRHLATALLLLAIACCLSCAGTPSPRAQALTEVRSADPQTRFLAVQELALMPLDEGILGALIVATMDGDWQVRGAAIKALGDVGTKEPLALQTLEAALGDEVPDVVVQVPLALARMGPEPAVLDILCLALENPHGRVQAEAARALEGFGPDAASSPDVVPALMETLENSNDAEVELATINALGAIGPPAASALPAIERYLEDSRLDIRYAAEDAIDRISAR